MLLGETFATAVLSAEASDGAKSAFELFFDHVSGHFSDLWESWTDASNGVTWLLTAPAPAAAILTGYLLAPGAPRPHPQPQPWT
ncbi:hypothetical protein [Streptomyces sp. NBC_01803]|uniref:hypothetical protein n=1 Tax=Streptomyces sp. NBC_01803 TaxID=2975946 RepID=UPI002DDC0850|nr:hypothetical protein [Streptomyces sp. NBC_01803]WSA45180.1 hypothetical protein OIE51_13770 [Streptomyces sp. NBC_01803]